MSAVEEIRIKLEARLTELEQEIESLHGALAALDAEAAAAASGTAPELEPVVTANGRRRRGSGAARRTTTPVRTTASRRTAAAKPPSAELERLLAETGGTSTVELARHTGADYGAVLARIAELERAAGR